MRAGYPLARTDGPAVFSFLCRPRTGLGGRIGLSLQIVDILAKTFFVCMTSSPQKSGSWCGFRSCCRNSPNKNLKIYVHTVADISESFFKRCMVAVFGAPPVGY